MMYCILAVAPGRSGWDSAIFRPSSNHSCVRYFAMPRTLPSGQVADTGEEVVLGQLGLNEGLGQHVVVVGVDGAGHLGWQGEPERRRRIDLRLVGEQCTPAHVFEVGDVDARGRRVL